MTRLIVKALTWVAAQLGYVMLYKYDVEAARKKLELLLQYAQRSGALQHPTRIKARGKIIAASAAILQNLEVIK